MRTLRNNSLTLILIGMFLLTWGGQFLTGRAENNSEREEHGLSPLSMVEYLKSGHFWQATSENWESEFLQMGMYVVLTIFLYQKGSPESKDPDEKHADCDDDPAAHKDDPKAPYPVRRGGFLCKLYANSLSLAFLALFLASIAVHAVQGKRAYNEKREMEHQPAASVFEYVQSSQFWFESLQNWQSEFMSIAAMVYLSVYLRQRHSPESKPVHAAHDAHE